MTSAVGAGGHRKQCNGQHCGNGPAHLISLPGHLCTANATIFEEVRCGSAVAGLGAVQTMRARIERLRREFDEIRRTHPRLVRGVMLGSVVAFLVALTVSGWFLVSLRRGLPNVDALRRLGEMDQATAVFDRNDQLAFTIFKEQRIAVPLAQISPNLKAAILAI